MTKPDGYDGFYADAATEREATQAASPLDRKVIRQTLGHKATMLQRQCLPLEAKVRMSLERIRAWYEHWDGEVYIAWSAGKDSDVLKHLVWSLYPDVKAVHSRTGLEYPEIDEHAKQEKGKYPDRIVFVKPKRNFRDVVLNEGYPVVSKKTAMMLRRMREHANDPAWENTLRLYNTGVKMDGSYSQSSKLPMKWRKLLDVDWKISDRCCDILKKEPMREYETETGKKRMMGIMAAEGGLRSLREHCNVFDTRDPSSAPMLFWTEADVWEYIKTRNLPYSKIYDMGETRTGCMFCGFGVHLEKGNNRFQRMAKSHPKQWNYCINDLGMGKVLDALGVEYEEEPAQSVLPLTKL